MTGANRNKPTSPPRQDRHDDAPSAPQTSLFGRAGQLALPGHDAQLGLDGAAYAPPPSGEAASPYLGPLHRVSHETWEAPEPDPDCPPEPSGSPAQLGLPIDAWETSPQLTLWQRLDVAKDLLWGRTACNRDAKCQRTRYEREASVFVTRYSSGTYGLRNVISCDKFSCPACGPRKCRAIASKLAVAMQRHMAPGEPWSDCWMLTLAPPHYADESSAIAVERLYRAGELFHRSGAWRAFARRWAIVGKVRVLDATHGGANGSHPHFHALLFARQAWMPSWWQEGSEQRERRERRERRFERWESDVDDELVDAWVAASWAPMREAPVSSMLSSITALRMVDRVTRERFLDEVREPLLDAWEQACLAAGIRIADRAAFRARSLKLSPSEEASAYVVKWGLADEVGAPTAKARSHLRLLDLVRAGHDRAGDIYRAWREAVHGVTWVTGLADICARLGVTDDDADAYVIALRERRAAQLAAAGTPLVEVRELRLEIRPHLFAGAARRGWVEVFAFIDELDASIGDVQAIQVALDQFLWCSLTFSEQYQVDERNRPPPAPS